MRATALCIPLTRNVSSVGKRGQIVVRQRSLINAEEEAQGGRGVRRAAAKACGHGERLDQAETAKPDAGNLHLCSFRRLDDEVAAIERAGERTVNSEVEPIPRRELDGIAHAGEGNEAAQFVKAVGAASQDLEREVQLGPGDVAKRGYRGVFWSVWPGPAAAWVPSDSSRPEAIFSFSVTICSSSGSRDRACSH